MSSSSSARAQLARFDFGSFAAKVSRTIRARAFDRSTRYAYYCKVQVTMSGDRQFDQDTFLAFASDLYNHLLPELMQCLPDWAEVEARDDAETTSSDSSTTGQALAD